jgi:hypothetical protein
MADSRTISGTVTTTTMDSRYRVAFDLMEKIAAFESGAETSKRDYWLKLYGQCHRMTGGADATEVLKAS